MSGTLAEPGRIAQWQLRLIRRVIKIYAKLRGLEPVVAQNCEERPSAHSQRWTPEVADYIIDVRRALADAIKDHPDRQRLIRAWARMVDDDSTIRNIGAELIRLIAPVFEERGLDPTQYFLPKRLRSRR